VLHVKPCGSRAVLTQTTDVPLETHGSPHFALVGYRRRHNVLGERTCADCTALACMVCMQGF